MIGATAPSSPHLFIELGADTNKEKPVRFQQVETPLEDR